MLAGASTHQLVVDGGTGGNNEDAGSASVGGGNGRYGQYHKAHQFRGHFPRTQHIKDQMGHLGLAQHHTDPDIQGQAQEQGRQLHHHAQVHADTVVVTLANKLGASGKTHEAVQRDGQQGFAPGAAFFKILGRTHQLVQCSQGQDDEASNPELMQVEVVDLYPVRHGADFFAAINPGRHQQHYVGGKLAPSGYQVVLAGAWWAQGNMVAGQGGRRGTDDDQQTQQQTLVVAQAGHNLGNAPFQGAEGNDTRSRLLLDHFIAIPPVTTDLAGCLQRGAQGAFVHLGAEDACQRVIRHLLFLFGNGSFQFLVQIRVTVTGGLFHHAGTTEKEVSLPGIFADFQQLGMDDFAGRQKNGQQQKNQGGKR